MTKHYNKPTIGIIPHMFIEQMSAFHLDELVALLHPLAEKLVIIAGGYQNETSDVEVVQIHATQRASFTRKALEQISVHAQILRVLASRRKEIDILFFFLGGVEFAIPLLFAKMLNIRCFSILAGFGNAPRIRSIKESGAPRQFGELTRLYILTLLERLTCRLSDKLIVYDEALIDQGGLRKYQEKITVAHRHFVNFDAYRFSADIEQRDNVVSYVGRLHEEKGVLNLVKAIPDVLDTCEDAKFVLVGTGHLETEIRRYIANHHLESSMTLAGWVAHQELPDYLQASKLLVLPSYTEGLPHAMLEAMACGTPVLATPVGAVPQVIQDKVTGFILPENSPACVAESIIKALAYPDLEHIISNARMLVEAQFRYENVLEVWQNVISDT